MCHIFMHVYVFYLPDESRVYKIITLYRWQTWHICRQRIKVAAFLCSVDMSNMHKSVFEAYERSKDVVLEFSEENPETKYDFQDEIGR